MDINAFENVPGLRSIAESKGTEESRTELGQSEFLKLMTTQLANQDPMKPMDNGDFMGQIAQFGTVNGINDLLASFQDLASNLQSSQALQASSLIGRQVLVNLDQGYLPNQGALLGAVELDSSATDVAVNIYNANGESLSRVELGPQPIGQLQFNWDGNTFNGQRAPAGRYRIEVEASFGGNTEMLTPQVLDQVRSLTLGGPGQPMQVDLANLGTVSFNQVNQIQ